MATQPYKDAFGKRLPSVTTILSRFKESGGLLHWANAQGLEGKTLDDARKEVATPGTIAHEMIEAHLRGAIGDDASKLVGWKNYDQKLVDVAKQSFAAAMTWKRMSRLQFDYTEVPLVSKQHAFGGTLDVIGHMEGNEQTLVLADWKCANSVYADYLYQMAAYKLLWEENYPQHKITGGFHLCRFAKEQGDFSHHHFPNLDEEAKTFLAMRDLYDRVKLSEKRVR
jgi:hypothetical protein